MGYLETMEQINKVLSQLPFYYGAKASFCREGKDHPAAKVAADFVFFIYSPNLCHTERNGNDAVSIAFPEWRKAEQVIVSLYKESSTPTVCVRRGGTRVYIGFSIEMPDCVYDIFQKARIMSTIGSHIDGYY